MNEPIKPAELVASAITREREKAGYSLSGLALKAGLAKSTLSQLESGKGNPSIETIWSIASALDIPFSFLFEHQEAKTELIRKGGGTKIPSDQKGVAAYLLAKCPPYKRRDLYTMVLEPDTLRHAEPHPPGTIEHLYVVNGKLTAGPLDQAATLETGDYYRYSADTSHAYKAAGTKVTLLIIMETNQ